jgi:peptide subunit release factor 1 (eRF1)
VTRSAKKDGAVLGLEETLEMVNEDRVNTLVVLRGYQQEGYRCKNCTFLTARMLHTCASCGGEMVKVTDVIDRAINRVMRKGGDVVIIHSSRSLEDAGSLGAILRF